MTQSDATQVQDQEERELDNSEIRLIVMKSANLNIYRIKGTDIIRGSGGVGVDITYAAHSLRQSEDLARKDHLDLRIDISRYMFPAGEDVTEGQVINPENPNN